MSKDKESIFFGLHRMRELVKEPGLAFVLSGTRWLYSWNRFSKGSVGYRLGKGDSSIPRMKI